MEMKTTPTPWHYQEDSDAYTHIIRGPKNQFVASGPQDSSGRSEADLRFIVQCVNSERPADPAGETKNPGGLLGILRKRALECQGLSIEAMQIQPALVIELCVTVATLRAQVARLAEATRLVDFYRDTHGCEDSDICTGCAAATLFLKQTRAQATPPSPAPDAVREKAQALVDAMETCHECKGTVLVEERPVHCEDCSGDCDSHEGAECPTIYGLHLALKCALAESAGKGE